MEQGVLAFHIKGSDAVHLSIKEIYSQYIPRKNIITQFFNYILCQFTTLLFNFTKFFLFLQDYFNIFKSEIKNVLLKISSSKRNVYKIIQQF